MTPAPSVTPTIAPKARPTPPVLDRFADRIEPHKDRIPAEARRVIDEEMAKLSNLESASSEFNVTRNYLDWLTAVPWGHYTQERLDIQYAQKVNDPYGIGQDQPYMFLPFCGTSDQPCWLAEACKILVLLLL